MSNWIKSMVVALHEHLGSSWVKIGRDIMQTDAMTQAVISQQEKLSDDPYGIVRNNIGTVRVKYNEYLFRINKVLPPKNGRFLMKISDNFNLITAYLSKEALDCLRHHHNVAVDLNSLDNMYGRLHQGYFVINTETPRKINLFIEKMSYIGERPKRDKQQSIRDLCKNINEEAEVKEILSRINSEIKVYEKCDKIFSLGENLDSFDFLKSPESIFKYFIGQNKDEDQDISHSQVYLRSGPGISYELVRERIEESEETTTVVSECITSLDHIRDLSTQKIDNKISTESKENYTEEKETENITISSASSKNIDFISPVSPIKSSIVQYVVNTASPIKKQVKSTIEIEIDKLEKSKTKRKSDLKLISSDASCKISFPADLNDSARKKPLISECADETLNSIVLAPSVLKTINSSTEIVLKESTSTNNEVDVGKPLNNLEDNKEETEWSPVEELTQSQVDEMINETLAHFPEVLTISQYRKNNQTNSQQKDTKQNKN